MRVFGLRGILNSHVASRGLGAGSLAPSSTPTDRPTECVPAFPPMMLLTERSSSVYLDVLIAEASNLQFMGAKWVVVA